jgi:hypothetical protein
MLDLPVHPPVTARGWLQCLPERDVTDTEGSVGQVGYGICKTDAEFTRSTPLRQS